MNSKYTKALSILLAMFLQAAPLLRSMLPQVQGLAPSAWAVVLKIGVGAVALLGFDAVSQASSISISPANATVGQPYVGTITYSGGHAGSVSSMTISNICIGSASSFLSGLTVVYAGVNKAVVSGTPTKAGNFQFTVKVFDSSSCGSGENDTRSTVLVIGSGTGGPAAPTITAAPPNTVAQVGSDVQLSGGASGNPIPGYQWWQGATPIPGATNSVYTITNIQLASAGIYTLTASNSQNAGATFFTLPKANCYLSVCITGGTNFTTLGYTNYLPAGLPVTLFSYITNVSNATNYYVWTKGGVVYSTSNTLPIPATSVIPAQSGTFTVTFNSTNNNGPIISGQNYDSYWAFGFGPAFTNQPPATTNVSAGATVTLSAAIRGELDTYCLGGAAYVTNSGVACVFWYKDNTLVAAQSYALAPSSGVTYSNTAVTAMLTLPGVSAADAGSYTVVATNFWGSVTSSPSLLSIGSGGSAPGIAVPPPPALALLAGQNSAISVTVTGTPPFGFQWQKGGVPLANNDVYAGVNTNVLTLTGVPPGAAGGYALAITNSEGSITSAVTAVTVNLPPALGLSAGSSGTMQLSGNTVTNATYIVEMATNLASPTWEPVLTNNTGPGGAVSFQGGSTSGTSGFYRIRFP